MSRLGTHLDAIDAWLSALPYGNALLVTECRRQLDLIDAEDIAKVGFKTPAGFLVLPRFRLLPRADGGKDCEIWIYLAIAAQARSGATADANVIDRAIALAAALDDQVFGQLQCLPPADIECRPVLSSGIETKGIAVAAVSFRQLILRVVEPPAATQGLISAVGTGTPRPGEPGEFLAGDGQLTPEEQAIVDGWQS
ncbi:MAG: hypothetical protein FD175_569 [Beijerinckiaceae bacterium]|nr:MAG: hypothetical protein FD175_569 [Beijerinckiaceae bacterium]